MADKPNVLLITGDHIRYDALGCNGNDFVKTPNLDKLAAHGVTFTNSFTPNPICVPGRAIITTGNYSHKCTGNKGNSGRIRDDQPKIAEHFNNHGYKSYALGKLHYVPYTDPAKGPRLLHGFQHAELCEEGRMIKQFAPFAEGRGLEDYHDYLYNVGWGGYERAHGIGNNDIHPAPSPLPKEHYVDRWCADRTIAAIENHTDRGDDPFFMWMSFTKPHSPYDPPRPYDVMYDPREIPQPHGADGECDGFEKRSSMLKAIRDSHGFQNLSPEGVQVARAHYYGMITFQDECIGSVVDVLEEKGLLENTIIVYTGDHGDLLGDFGTFYKANFMNGSTRIPSVWHYPQGIKAGLQPDCLMGLQDVLPTLAGLTGTAIGQDVDGMDLTGALNNDCGNERDYYIGQTLGPGRQQYMVCTKEYKYIYSEINGLEELYDIKNDYNELWNIADQKTEIAAEYRKILIQWCKDNGDRDMLDGDDLVHREVDLSEDGEFRAGSMGWRWY